LILLQCSYLLSGAFTLPAICYFEQTASRGEMPITS
jgi:hypothetical protein